MGDADLRESYPVCREPKKMIVPMHTTTLANTKFRRIVSPDPPAHGSWDYTG